MTTPNQPDTPRYPVRLVSVRTGLSPHVLRAWERRYGVVTPTRTEGGQRLYSELDIERLRLIKQLADRGHSIGQIATLPLAELGELSDATGDGDRIDGLPSRHARSAEADDARAEQVSEAIVGALRATRRLDAVELQAVLERAAVTLGVPAFIDEVVAPTLVRVGHGWAEGSVSVAQEHMATAVFRRVLGWLLRVYEVRDAAVRLVVATPPSQVHELGALMVAASAAAEGWAVTYLGPDLPVADLVSAVEQANAQVVAISAVYVPEGADLLGTLREMRAGIPEGIPLLVGGAAASGMRDEAEVEGTLVIESLPDLRTLLRRMEAEVAA